MKKEIIIYDKSTKEYVDKLRLNNLIELYGDKCKISCLESSKGVEYFYRRTKISERHALAFLEENLKDELVKKFFFENLKKLNEIFYGMKNQIILSEEDIKKINNIDIEKFKSFGKNLKNFSYEIFGPRTIEDDFFDQMIEGHPFEQKMKIKFMNEELRTIEDCIYESILKHKR